MTVELQLAQIDDAAKWDAINAKSVHGTLFHTWNWLKITEKHTGMTLYPLIGIKGSTPVGIFPLFFQKKGPLRMVFSPPPHAALFYLGPVMLGFDKSQQDKKELLYSDFQNSVDTFIRNDLRAQYISISLSPALQDPRPFKWSGYSISMNYDYVTDLSIGPDQLLATLDKNGRQNLNRARKKGITVELGGKTEFGAILDLMEIRYIQQGKHLTASRDYYLDIYDAFKENIKIFVAKVNGEIISGSIEIQYRDTHYSWIGNPKPKYPVSPSPNDLLIWESVRHAYEQGFRYYVTMSAASDERLYSYYASKFDPELSVYFTAKKDSVPTRLFEKGYLKIFKPLSGWMKNLAETN